MSQRPGLRRADPPVVCRLKEARVRRGWTQAQLAERTGVSRAAVSAVETGRIVPSTAAALALGRALGWPVEELFLLQDPARAAEWAWPPPGDERCWKAEVDGRLFRYPLESTSAGVLPPDEWPQAAQPSDTLVLGGCDPATAVLAGLLAAAGVRLLPLTRSSRRALELLREGRIHVAGIHLGGDDPAGNRRVVEELLGPGFRLVHVARWTEGVAVAPGLALRSVSAAVRARLRWVGREEGSGARRCLDEILHGRRRPEGYDRTAADHRGVVETIRSGWAQAGVCIELTARETGLDFLPVAVEAYHLCFPSRLEDDPRIEALVDAIRSRAFRGALASLPGYDARRTGEPA